VAEVVAVTEIKVLTDRVLEALVAQEVVATETVALHRPIPGVVEAVACTEVKHQVGVVVMAL
jgi:hypothetical protein